MIKLSLKKLSDQNASLIFGWRSKICPTNSLSFPLLFFVGEEATSHSHLFPVPDSQFPLQFVPGHFHQGKKKSYIFLSLIFSTPFLSVRASCQQPLLLSHYSERFLLLFGQVAFSLSLSTLNPFTEISCRHNMVKVLPASLCSSHCQ